MRYSRREIGKLALATLPGAALLERPLAVLGQSKPNSVVNGVNLGTITYSYRSMPDQRAEAILRYIVDSGISQIEFMGAPVEAFAGAPQMPRSAVASRGASSTPDQQAIQREHATKLRAWRTSVSMDRFKALRSMFNDAGVSIYAWKQLATDMTDEEIEYVFNVAEALGNTHVTLELTDDVAQLKRLGQFAEKKKIRTVPANGQKNLPWGTGDTPLVQILQTVRKNRWKMPATIELEYEVPRGSDAVREVAKCFEFCKRALA